MQPNFFNELSSHGLTELSGEELLSTHGGGGGGLLLNALLFCVSPALGIFHLGVKAGYAEAAG